MPAVSAIMKTNDSPDDIRDSSSTHLSPIAQDKEAGRRRVRFSSPPRTSPPNGSANNTTPPTSSEKGTFKASYGAHTPVVEKVAYKEPKERASEAVAPESTLSRPNYEDILRRVSVVIHKHIENCDNSIHNSSAFDPTLADLFAEEKYVSPQYVYHFVRQPIARLGFCYGIRQVKMEYAHPSLSEVHTFLRTLFVKAQLSPECSIVCLIYVERLMEQARVPLLAKNWRPCLICGLLLASKVWQDLSSWNSEIASIYPQFSINSINELESTFCQHIKWELYISSSLYAKYYFALRSLTEKRDFRRHYNAMVTNAPGAQQVAIRSEGVKETMLHTTLSKSL